jgi:uncharacterized membrane protein YedE/YeeE
MGPVKYALGETWRNICVEPYPARAARAESRRMVGAKPTERLHVGKGHERTGLQRAAGRGISVGFGQALSGGSQSGNGVRALRAQRGAARAAESNGSRYMYR